MDEKLIHVTQVKEILGATLDTLKNWEKRGILKPIRIGGGHRRYKESDIKKLIEESQVK